MLSGARLQAGQPADRWGARLKVTSSERAALSGVVQRKRDGRWRAVGTKRWSVAAGANDKTFYGKTSEQRLQVREVPGPADRHRPGRQHLGHHHHPLPRRPRLITMHVPHAHEGEDLP